jgi:hypothetical protein
MTEIWFTAVHAFDASRGDEWQKYLDWAKIPQLKEVISLDSALCPSEFTNLSESDWEHNIHADYRTTFFKDVDYLLERFSGKRTSTNILAVCLEPSFDVRATFPDDRFRFQGYDLVGDGMSVITNCGGFEKVFQTSDISNVGLFDSFDFARQAQKQLLEYYPEEHHARAELWAIWKMTPL